MGRFRNTVVCLGFASACAGAQMPPAGPPPRVGIAALLQIDTASAATVDAILKASRDRMMTAREQIGPPTSEATRSALHAAMQAIRADTDRQLAAVLTADQIERLREAMPRRRHPDGAPPAAQ